MQEMMFAAAVSDNAKYVTAAHYRIKNVSFKTLAERFELLLSRHEILRTRPVNSEGKPMLRVSDAPCARLIEVGSLPAAPFFIDPLGDEILIKLFVCKDELLLVFSHILLDGWSVTLLLRELLSEKAPELTAPPFRYYVKRLNSKLTPQDIAAHNEHSPLPAQFEQASLPFQTETAQYERSELRFKLDNTAQIKAAAKELSVSVGRFIEGVWGLLCARYAGGSAAIAAVDSGRFAPVPGVAKIAGMLVSTLPLEIELTENLRFCDFIKSFSDRAAEKIRDGYTPPTGRLRSLISVEFSDFSQNESFTLLGSNARLVTDLDFVIVLGEEISCRFEYNTFAFSDFAASLIRGHFLKLLSLVISDATAPVCSLDFLTDREKAFIFGDNLDAQLYAQSNLPITEKFRKIAAKHPNRTAITDNRGALTYAQADSLSDNIAQFLINQKISGGVIIRLPRSADFVIAELGVMKAGCYFIPQSPDSPSEKYSQLLETLAPSFVISSDNYAEAAAFTAPLSAPAAPLPEIAPDTPAYAITTSGTTGKPKGVLVSHRAFSHHLAWAARTYRTDSDTSTALIYGFTFDGSFGSIYNPLLAGGTLHILDDETRFDIPKIADFCREFSVTHLDLPASLLPDFTKLLAAQNTKPPLRYIITGGEQVKPFTDCGLPVSNEYGPTECTVCVTQSFLTADSDINIGSVIPNNKLYILDSQKNPCPLGVFGEAYVAGVQVALGYIGDETNAAFSENPFGGGRMYKTGDRMRYVPSETDFVLQFAGRNDSQIKLNGYRIELGEIEAAARRLCGIASAAALCGTYIALYAVCEDAAAVDSKLREALAPYMMPVVIPVPEIPLNESGKPDFKKLAEFSPKAAASDAEEASPNCRLLLDLLLEIAGLHAAGGDNFTALGGNSITAMKLSFALAERSLELSPAEIITSKTIAQLSEKLTLRREESSQRSAFTPPDSLKAMVYLSEKFGSSVYTVSARADCPASRDEVAERIRKAAALHDILRCRFILDPLKNITAEITETPNIKLLGAGESLPERIDPLGETLVYAALCEGALELRYHHIVLDGYSVSLLLSELIAGSFPETAHSYAQFAGSLGGREADFNFYNTRLADAVPIPLFESQNAAEKMSAARYFDGAFYEKIKAAAQRVPVTPAVFIMAAFGTFLTVYGDSVKTYIPVVASFRNSAALLGCAAQTFPVPFDSDGSSFGAAATRLQEALAATTSHVNIPEQYLLLPYIFVDDDRTEGLTDSQNYALVITSGGVILYDEASVSPELLEVLKKRLRCALENAIADRACIYESGEYSLLTNRFALGKTPTQTPDYLESFRPAQALNLAQELKARAIGAGDLVAIEHSRQPEALFTYAGVSLSGAAILPLDTALPDERKRELLDDCRPAALVKNGEITPLPDRRRLPEDTAYIIYTSGTTGRPKGVPISKSALQSQIDWTLGEFNLSEKDTLLHFINFAFDPSVWILFSGFASGAKIKIVPEALRLSPELIARFIEDKKITVAVLPASAAFDILQSLRENSLRILFLGGDKISIPPRSPFTQSIRIINLYGPTETCVNAAFYTLPPDCERTACIGRPVGGTKLYILDKNSRPAPIGVRGQLHIGGDKLSSGYINRPAETLSAFITHPDFGRIYKTGDIASWNPDGTIEFIGRADRQVKIRGFRTELSEIEAALSFVSGSPAAVTYENGVLAGFVSGELTEEKILEQLRAKLPAFMVPNRIIKTPKLPLTPNGKIDYNALVIPQKAQASSPLTETEKLIAAAFEEVLSLKAGSVDKFGDFFALGGHSLKLFSLTGVLALRGLNISINDVLKNPVVEKLALLAEEKSEIAKASSAAGAFDEASYAACVAQYETADLSKPRRADNIMITGATGFLGAHLLRECLRETSSRIFLPLRGETSRIKGVLNYYFPGEAFDFSRLEIFTHDISEKPPETEGKIDLIYHCAADVRHYAPFEDSFRANFTATEHMIRLAKAHGAYLAHISTASAVNRPVISESSFDLGEDFENVYQHTKQLAERLVLSEDDLSFGIFRVGNVTPSLEYRVPALTAETNSYLTLLKLLIKSRTLPDFRGRSGYCFADMTARAICLIAQRDTLNKSIFHITNPNILTFRQIFDILRVVTLAETDKIPDELRGIYAQRLIEKKTDVSSEIKNDATTALLRRLGFEWREPDLDYLRDFTGYE
jgi:amino acid adenylation domain-containing protein